MFRNPEDTLHLVNKIMRYEEGDMSHDEIVALFQQLLDNGMVWRLQGSYGRTAKALIDAGEISTDDFNTEEENQ